MSPSDAESGLATKAEMPADKLPAVSIPQADTAAVDPSDIYSPKCAELARALRSRGATDGELCAALEVSAETLAVWQNQFKEFAQACADNEAARMRRLRDHLFELANGYVRTEQKIVIEGRKRKKITTKTEMPPSLEAIKYILSGQQMQETDLAALLRQMGEMRTHRFRPVPLRPGEEKTLEDWPK